MFGLGVQELVVILVIIVLLFGAKKLPELGKGIGDSIRTIKESSKDNKDNKKDE